MDLITLALSKKYTEKRLKEINPSDTDLSNYATKEYVDEAVANFDSDTGLTVNSDFAVFDIDDNHEVNSSFANQVTQTAAQKGWENIAFLSGGTGTASLKQTGFYKFYYSSTGDDYKEYLYRTVAPTHLTAETENDLIKINLMHSEIHIKINNDGEIQDYDNIEVVGDSVTLDIPKAEIDETKYYTKEQVDSAIATAIANALGTAETALDEIIEGGE